MIYPKGSMTKKPEKRSKFQNLFRNFQFNVKQIDHEESGNRCPENLGSTLGLQEQKT